MSKQNRKAAQRVREAKRLELYIGNRRFERGALVALPGELSPGGFGFLASGTDYRVTSIVEWGDQPSDPVGTGEAR